MGQTHPFSDSPVEKKCVQYEKNIPEQNFEIKFDKLSFIFHSI